MSKYDIIKKLGEDISEYIKEFERSSKNAGKSQQAYEYAIRIKKHDLPTLCDFAERYLGIEIEITETPVKSQFDTGRILGYKITIKTEGH